MGTKRVGFARIRSLINENTNALKFKEENQISVTTTTTLTAAQSGATVYWTHGTTHNVKMPTPVAGLNYTIVMNSGANAAHNLESEGSGKFVGRVVVLSATADKCGAQVETSGTDFFKMKRNDNTLGGMRGDRIEISCIADGEWTVTATLVTSQSSVGTVACFAD
jgi:hypothetical protein